jgi:bacterioferritin-associated ferredoxin
MDDSPSVHPAVRGLKTVCRCNNIKYRTIERVIREGACAVAEIAKRTGATTGYCGGTCTPDILAMIAEHGPAVAAPSKAASNTADAWWVRKQ